MTRDASCYSCEFWFRLGDPDNPICGECRRRSPRTFTVDERDDEDNERLWACWPRTDGSDWCGEWQPKED